jgi:choline dehydrogenase
MTFDYIIIGAGSAGCVLAHRLSADPSNQVLLLEAGKRDKKLEIHIPAGYVKLHRSEMDWGFESEPQAHLNNRRLYLPRGKTLGGCSSTNAMAYIRGNKEDYNDWAKMGALGWDYDSVLPYFKKSEHNEQIGHLEARFHGSGGPLNVTYAQNFHTAYAKAFIQACAEAGISENQDFNGEEQEGAGFFQFSIKNNKRCSTAAAFLKPILHRPNLKVFTGAQVNEILIEKDRATGVKFSLKKGSQFAKANKEVILSAGAFQSPQLLMLSGIGAANELKQQGIGLKKDLPGVGKNLQDHLFCPVASIGKAKGLNHALKPLNELYYTLQYFLRGTGPLTIGPLEANAFTKVFKDNDRPDLQLHFAPLQAGYEADLHNYKTLPTDRDGYSILPTLLKPKSRGYLTLRNTNPADAPLIQPNFLSVEHDLKILVEGTKKAIALHNSSAFAELYESTVIPILPSSDDSLAEHIRRRSETVYHPVGTCKMGSDEGAVVNAQLQVIGIEGLRVADASVMPSIVSGNTNAACIMIGEKAADLILGKTQHDK